MNNQTLYIQYGSGDVAIDGWVSFDASPTLRLQNIPLLGNILKPWLNCVFDKDVRYGDIIKGLPVPNESADGVFCAHVLEHLSLNEFHKAINNTYAILKKGGCFRCVVPNLELYLKEYMDVISGPLSSRHLAALDFCKNTALGRVIRNNSMVGRLSELYGNSPHRWMWDQYSLAYALREHGFVDVKEFAIGIATDPMFLLPERAHQFQKGLGLQCYRPG